MVQEVSEDEGSDDEEMALLKKEAEEIALRQQALAAKMKMAKLNSAKEKERMKKLEALDYEEHTANEEIKKLKARIS